LLSFFDFLISFVCFVVKVFFSHEAHEKGKKKEENYRIFKLLNGNTN